MTTGFAFKILFEISLILLIAYGYIHEDKIIAFERELFPVLKFAFNKYILHKVPQKKVDHTKEAIKEAPVVKHRAEVRKFPIEKTHRNNVA